MAQEYIAEYDALVASLAVEYHRRYPMLEALDIQQMLWLWFLTHPRKYAEWSALEQKDKDKLIAKSLRNAALKYCEKEKAKTVGYEKDDLFYYEPELVEALLPAVLRTDYNITHKLNLGRTGKPTAPNEGGNLPVMMIEIDYAYWKLNKEDRKLLFFRHAEAMDFKEIANLLSLGTDDAARMRHKRAMRRLINKIGGFRPYRDEDTKDSTETEESPTIAPEE